MERTIKRGRRSAVSKMGFKILVVETGEIFDSYNEVAKHIGGTSWGVSRCLDNNHPHKTHKGYHFEFVDYSDESSPW